jgi:hypothetical protein
MSEDRPIYIGGYTDMYEKIISGALWHIQALLLDVKVLYKYTGADIITHYEVIKRLSGGLDEGGISSYIIFLREKAYGYLEAGDRNRLATLESTPIMSSIRLKDLTQAGLLPHMLLAKLMKYDKNIRHLQNAEISAYLYLRLQKESQWWTTLWWDITAFQKPEMIHALWIAARSPIVEKYLPPQARIFLSRQPNYRDTDIWEAVPMLQKILSQVFDAFDTVIRGALAPSR